MPGCPTPLNIASLSDERSGVISRRSFLRSLAATAVALSLDPYRGVATRGDWYENERLGLRLEKPPGWEFSSIADFAALRERQVLDQVLDHEPHPLRDPGNLPVVLIEDPSRRHGTFAPCVGLYDEPLRGAAPIDQVSAHGQMLSGFAQFYSHVEVHRSPEVLRLRGASATSARWSYLHELEDGTSCPLHIESLLVFREPRVHTFYLVDAHPEAVVPRSLWGTFIDSLEYERA